MNLLNILITNWFKPALVFHCIEVIGLGEGSHQYNFLSIKSKSNKLEILKREKGIGEFGELKKHLKKDIPIVIAVTGRGVLIKKLEAGKVGDNTDFLKYILPNAKSDDFIVQTQNNDFGSIFCAVARRQDIETITALFTSCDLFVVSLSIGILSIGSIINLLEIEQNRIVLGNHKIQIRNDQIFDISANKYRKQESNYKIGNDEIEPEFLTAFSAGFQYFILNHKNTLANNSVFNEKDYKYYKRFKATKMAFLLSCLIVLLVNFFIFDHFNNLLGGSGAELASYNKLLSTHASLKKEFQNKEAIVKSLGLEKNLKYSFIADQIASTVISSITLLELNIHPVKSTRNKKLEFFKEKLLIKGTTKSANELNNWIKEVRNLNWISSLTITDFSFSDKENDAIFEIELMLSNSRAKQ